MEVCSCTWVWKFSPRFQFSAIRMSSGTSAFEEPLIYNLSTADCSLILSVCSVFGVRSCKCAFTVSVGVLLLENLILECFREICRRIPVLVTAVADTAWRLHSLLCSFSSINVFIERKNVLKKETCRERQNEPLCPSHRVVRLKYLQDIRDFYALSFRNNANWSWSNFMLEIFTHIFPTDLTLRKFESVQMLVYIRV
jgi:hypothetical protein